MGLVNGVGMTLVLTLVAAEINNKGYGTRTGKRLVKIIGYKGDKTAMLVYG